MTRALGFGATTHAAAADVVALARASLAASGPADLVATIDRRDALAQQVARDLGLPLRLLPAAALAAVDGVTQPSAAAAAATGTPSVAEAAALLAAGTGARLVVARRTGRQCTCAVAERP